MSAHVTVAFQGIPPSDALRADIEQRAAKLVRFAARLQTCTAHIGREENRRRHGNCFHVRLLATLPGRVETAECIHEDVYVATHQAFDALRRQIEDYVRVHRSD